MKHERPVLFITGAARRIGAQIVRLFHHHGHDVVLHYHTSAAAAQGLQQQLCQYRPGSVKLLQADLTDTGQLPALAAEALTSFGRVDTLINNASSFYPTPLTLSSLSHWDDLMDSNLRAAFTLATALSTSLRQQRGSIINIVDIHANSGLKGYPIYSIAKAGLKMMTHALARELAPEVRVNGIAPGAILWPEDEVNVTDQQAILADIALGRIGCPEDIADAAWFLNNASYVTGQVIKVDGGRSLG